MRFEFVAAIHEEFGELGWRLKSQPNFDPLGGMAVAHDCLEHFTDSAEPKDEFLALGASLFVRDGYHAHRGRYEINPGVHVAADLPEIMRHIVHEGMGLPLAPRTRYLPDGVEYQIDLMFDSYRKELQEHSDYPDLEIDPETEKSIRSYLRMGYRKAVKRYGAHRRWDVMRLFCNIEDAANRYLQGSSEGQVLRVDVKLRSLDYAVRLLEWEDE